MFGRMGFGEREFLKIWGVCVFLKTYSSLIISKVIMRNEVQFRLSPTDPTTDTQLVVVSDGQATSQMMNI
jgi:hypothetical protein